MIEAHGVDYCIVINFSSRFANVTSEEFIEEYIIKNNVKEVIAGFDFTFGKFGKGNMSVLNEVEDFNTTIVGRQELGEEKYQRLLLEEALQNGELQKANEELGYLYKIKGTVVQGEKRGRTIGFPTANVHLAMITYYQKGVYAVSMEIGAEQKLFRGVANVGVKPTFHDPAKAEVVIEVNIFDFDENIYGEHNSCLLASFLKTGNKI